MKPPLITISATQFRHDFLLIRDRIRRDRQEFSIHHYRKEIARATPFEGRWAGQPQVSCRHLQISGDVWRSLAENPEITLAITFHGKPCVQLVGIAAWEALQLKGATA